MTVPDAVHYVSFTDERSAVVSEMEFVMDDEFVAAGMTDVSFVELAEEYFQLTPVPTLEGGVARAAEPASDDVFEAVENDAERSVSGRDDSQRAADDGGDTR